MTVNAQAAIAEVGYPPLVTDPRVLGPGLLPTPFTADEIRAGCPAGRTIELRVVEDGEEPYVQVNRYVICDETGAIVERGRQGGDSTSSRTTWAELQAHAAFPAGVTTVEHDEIEIPLGVLNCLRYTVRYGEDEIVFWFAQAFPGMPVRIDTREHGRTVSTTTMISST
jgi:hypothetical protein